MSGLEGMSEVRGSQIFASLSLAIGVAVVPLKHTQSSIVGTLLMLLARAAQEFTRLQFHRRSSA